MAEKNRGDWEISLPQISLFQFQCHHLEPQVTACVEEYFIKHWNFDGEKSIKKFQDAQFAYVTCCYFPLAEDQRITYAAMFLTLLFLIDDQLENMSFEEGRAYNELLMPLMKGEVPPDKNVPVQYIMYDLWINMRTCDAILADQILEPTLKFMRAQTDPQRTSIQSLGEYLKYRELDVGQELLAALMRYVMRLEITCEELKGLKRLEINCARHISVVNDISSWEKEVNTSNNSTKEGSILCSSVKVVAEEYGIDFAAAKRVLCYLCREWELVHLELVEQQKQNAASIKILQYCKGLELQLSGNEHWSRKTKRYNTKRCA